MFFETREAAKAFVAFKNKEREQNGIEAAEFPTAIRVMADNAMRKLTPFGKTIDDAVDHYVKHLKASEKSCTAEQLVKELLKAKKADGASWRTLDTLKCRLNGFAEEFDGMLVATITSKEIDEWLRSLPFSPVTRNHYRANVLSAFNFAIRSQYATENPVEGSVKAKVVGGTPGILTVEQAARLLEVSARELLPYFAIGLFAGLRRAELERLDWSEVDFESNLIHVKAEKAKTAQRRFVTIQPNLREWLLPYRKLKGDVTPKENYRQMFEAVRDAIGFDGRDDEHVWPVNALRHSFASYHMAQFQNAAITSLELGHSNSRITFAHYRELVKPKEAARYWKLRPMGKSRKIVSMIKG